MKIVRFSVKNPVFINLLMIVILIWGFITYQNLNREAFPEVSRDLITVTTTYSGSTPKEMEQLVTIPIENAIADVEGIQDINTISGQGRSVVTLHLFSDEDDPNRVLFDVQSEVDNISNLPDNADEPEVEMVETNVPVITVGISGQMTESNLYVEAQSIKDRLRSISGVSEIRVMGKRDRKIWVDVNPEESRHYEIYLPQIFNSVRESSFNRPGGRLPGKIRELLVRTVSEARTSGEVRQRVAKSGDLRAIKLDDLAEVYPGFENWSTRGRINGKPGVSMTLFKTNESDAINIVRQLEKMVSKINNSRSDIHLTLYNDISEYIKDRLATMTTSAQLALILILVVLFVTINVRIALMTALGLPVSVFGAFLVMNYFNLTINMITLFGFIIVLGIIVDDAIVITENIYRHMEEGKDPHQAAIDGTDEVFMPILVTIATNIAAFIPLAMIGGITGKFLVSIPMVLTITLLVSLFEAYVILPSHMAEFVRVNKTDGDDWRNIWLRPIRNFFIKSGSFCIRYRYEFAIGILVCIPIFMYATTYMPVQFFHMEDIKLFRINIQTPTGTSLDRTSELVGTLEEHVESLPDSQLRSSVSTIGWLRTRLGELRFSPERAQITVELTEPTRREKSGEDIIQELRRKMSPFDEFRRIEFIKQQAGPPTGKAVEIEISGPNLNTLRSISSKVKQKLHELATEVTGSTDKSFSPIYSIQDNIIQGKTELRVNPIPEKVGQYPIRNEQIARVVNLAVEGLEAASYQANREEIEVMTRLDPEYLTDSDQLKNVRIPLPNGKSIPLKQVANVERTPAPGEILRLNRTRTYTVSASVQKNIITGNDVNQKMQPFLEDLFKSYPEYTYNLGGEYEEQQEAYRDLGVSFAIAILVIYTILAGLFNSFLEPLVIVLTVPFSIVGVVIGLVVMGDAITFTAAMGTVALSGIVVNDALILLSFVNQGQSDTVSNIYLKVLRAIRYRIRPVIITTVTTIAGLFPIGFEIGLSGVESFLAPMAIAIMFGMAFATFVILVLVPMVYVIFTDMRSATSSLIKSINPWSS